MKREEEEEEEEEKEEEEEEEEEEVEKREKVNEKEKEKNLKREEKECKRRAVVINYLFPRFWRQRSSWPRPALPWLCCWDEFRFLLDSRASTATFLEAPCHSRGKHPRRQTLAERIGIIVDDDEDDDDDNNHNKNNNNNNM